MPYIRSRMYLYFRIQASSVFQHPSLVYKRVMHRPALSSYGHFHHTQTISVKSRQITRAVIIYIDCDRNHLFDFRCWVRGLKPRSCTVKLITYSRTDVNRLASRGLVHELIQNTDSHTSHTNHARVFAALVTCL